MTRLLSCLPLLALAACTVAAPPVPPAVVAPAVAIVEQRPIVTILISIDGLRPDRLGRGDTPVLDALAKTGVRAAMKPSFPTLTFPNHYTLVTGLRPDRHGIVANTMEAPEKPGIVFRTSATAITQDPFWWNQAEPVWVTAERAGIRTGTVFWPGSEVAIRGIRPGAWLPYNAAVTNRQRVATVIDWLRRPAAERPQFLTLYFDVVDKASHNIGFDTLDTTAAIHSVDTAIGGLRDDLAALGQRADLVIVSDHGMAPVAIDHWLPTGGIADQKTMRVTVEGPELYVYPLQPGGSVAAIAGRRAHFTCWTREKMPARFHYGRNPRVSPGFCLADAGWRFIGEGRSSYVRGDHGWDNDDPAMRALFIANGPRFAIGRTLPMFDNVDVAPLLRDLIGLPAGIGLDGDDRIFRDVMAKEE